MKTRQLVLLSLVLTLSISAPSAFADVTMVLIAPPPGPVLNGVYISPYTALIGPANDANIMSDGVATSVICDDFFTDVSTGTPPWQAIATNVSDLQGEATPDLNLKFDQNNATQQQFDYTVAAVLSTEILQAQQAGNLGAQGELSFALWGLFDSAAIAGDSVAQADLSNAQSIVMTDQLTPASFSNVTIYTPSPNQNASQEYIVVTPEAPAMVLLALYLTSLAGLAFLFRDRIKTVLS